jgi:hypothetical protein
MSPRRERWTRLLVRSRRLVSEADDPAEILRLLVDETVGQMRVAALTGLDTAPGRGTRLRLCFPAAPPNGAHDR